MLNFELNPASNIPLIHHPESLIQHLLPHPTSAPHFPNPKSNIHNPTSAKVLGNFEAH